MYRTLSGYLKAKYGARLRKICIDGGFSCPNRDGRCGIGGCIYCGERGAGEHIEGALSIREQVVRGLSQRADDGCIAYFQNFTSTYADIDTLRQRYDAALISDRILVLAIGTRPDCIDEEVAGLIASYKDRVDVWVELGLQTSNDRVADIINRGYKTEVYLEAAKLLNSYKIPFVTHMMIGLPGESREDVIDTARTIMASQSFGIKIHSTYVMEGTVLAEMYKRGEYTPITFDYYVGLCAEVLSVIGDTMVVHRITGDCPEGLLLAPEWSRDKQRVINEIQKRI